MKAAPATKLGSVSSVAHASPSPAADCVDGAAGLCAGLPVGVLFSSRTIMVWVFSPRITFAVADGVTLQHERCRLSPLAREHDDAQDLMILVPNLR